MKINTDVSFVTGASHKVCQDYARHGKDYVILSDGCSSSEDTDFGARILVKTAENLILNADGSIPRVSITNLIVSAFNYTLALSLPEESIDATLLISKVVGEEIKISVFGDGYIYLKMKDGTSQIIEIKFPTNYPFYLNYTRDNGRLIAVRQAYQEYHSFREITTHIFDIDFSNQKTGILEHGLTDADIAHNTCGFNLSFDINQISTVAIMSDGVGSFYNKETKNLIPAVDIIKELCSFKGTAGEAVHRRLNAFLKDTNKKNLVHDDDVSLGAIFIEEE